MITNIANNNLLTKIRVNRSIFEMEQQTGIKGKRWKELDDPITNAFPTFAESEIIKRIFPNKFLTVLKNDVQVRGRE